MARYVVVTPVTVPGSGYGQPPRMLKKGDIVELSAAEVTAIGGGNLRTTSVTTAHDQLGEAVGVSNGT